MPADLEVIRHRGRILANPDGSVPLQVWFGIGIKSDQLLRYAQKRNLQSPKCPNSALMAAIPVAVHLEVLCRARIHVTRIFSHNHDFVVALYSNYTQLYWEMEQDLEDMVLGQIKDEFHVNEDAMWYHPPLGTEAEIPAYGVSIWSSSFTYPLRLTQSSLLPAGNVA